MKISFLSHCTEAWETWSYHMSILTQQLSFPAYEVLNGRKCGFASNRRQSYPRQRTDGPQVRCSPETQPELEYHLDKPS